MPTFTKSQNAAADTWGKDVLVAAGAGSGKTTVLAERIIRRIKAGADIGDFLVATFTVDSAADLREKIGKRLEELCAEFPNEPRYRRQFFTLYSASIGTISSLCLKQVKQAAAALGLPAQSHVGDESLCEALLSECAEKTLDAYCESDTEKAALLLDNFAIFKHDKGLINTMTKLYGSLRSFPFYEHWLSEQVAFAKADEKAIAEGAFFDSRDGKAVKEHISALIAESLVAVEAMENSAESDKQEAFAAKIRDIVCGLKSALDQGYNQFCLAALAMPPRRSPNTPPPDFTASYTVANNNLKEIATYCRSESALCEEYSRIATITEALAEILTKLDESFSAAKREKALLDFADAEQFFLKLLATKTEKGLVKSSFCRTLSARYSDVFIDEYQDVSPLQDMIFALIGEGKRFMVGDAKQSIYGFRDAYPDIFIGYRDSFCDVAENGANACVMLNENFRCDKNVIDFCNHVFRKIYTEESAGSDYTKEALVMGKSESGDEKMCLAVFENRQSGCDDEYAFVAKEILSLCKKGVAPSDIAVLAKDSAILARVAQMLDKCQVPYSTKNKSALLKTPEVLLAVALLRVVDNPTDDISLAAVLRSPIFGFSAEELYKIRKGAVSLYDDLCATAHGAYPKGQRYALKKAALPVEKIIANPRAMRRGGGALAEKCTAFLKRLDAFRDKALILPAHSLLMYLYEETQIFAYATEGNEENYISNLYALYELTKAVESEAYKGISVITDYITKIADTKNCPTAANKTAENAVALLTMHGSKGLEFPYVFICGTGKHPRPDSATSGAFADYRGGISFDLSSQLDASQIKTMHKSVLVSVEKRRKLAENLRLLYVAFTRAKKKLYISATCKHPMDDFESRSVKKYACQADLFMNTVLGGGESFTLMRFAKDDTMELSDSYKPVESDSTDLAIPELYDMPKSVPVTAKYFVSATHRGESGLLEMAEIALIADRVPIFATDGGKKSGAQVGSANHAFMQFADYGAAEQDVKSEAARLLKRGFIAKEDYELLRYDMLSAFFKSEIYKELKRSPKVYREKRFSTRLDASLFTKQEGESVLVQGVIDCFFENADGSFTLLDYKTDSARAGDEEKLLEKHGTQLYLYSQYIKKLTGRPVSKAYIYSFALNKAIECKEGITE